jgi:hypothetical protein
MIKGVRNATTMQRCIVVKYVEVQPMGLVEYHELRGFGPPGNEQQGFLVLLDGPQNHPDYDGYITWWPRNIFADSMYIMPDDKDRNYANIMIGGFRNALLEE